jgi:hypothetical protein
MTRYLAATSLLICLAFVGCSGPTETKIERDTTYVPVHDSVKVALVRFISMMPDNSSISLKLTSNIDAPIYATTLTSTQASYLPFIPDSARTFYLYSSSQYLDAISLSDKQLRKGSVNTFALFLFPDVSGSVHVQALGGDNNDSMKVKPITPGYAMIRLIDGNSEIPSSLTVDLDTGSTSNPICTSQFAQQLPNYVQVPAGKHTLLLSNHADRSTIDGIPPIVSNFESGMFYTVRFLGDAQNPAKLIIDPE